ncbi:hypothetical protein CP983_26880 [Streptomyces chartreusis]|nr:hypothetical protein CP983_26880 [Streptomyces chartreusis]
MHTSPRVMVLSSQLGGSFGSPPTVRASSSPMPPSTARTVSAVVRLRPLRRRSRSALALSISAFVMLPLAPFM